MIYKWSRTGGYHRETSGENQDHICSMELGNNVVISLADGVSACTQAKEGAVIAADAITQLLSKKGSLLLDYEKERIAGITVTHILYELEQKAACEKRELTEYSSTVASVLLDKEKNRLLCFSLGDSIIIAVASGRCRILALPYDSTDGCCVTTSRDPEAEAVVKVIDAEGIDSVVICSDGAWRRMFSRNRIRTEVKDILNAGDYEGLMDYLAEHAGPDDSSFIAMDDISRRAA